MSIRTTDEQRDSLFSGAVIYTYSFFPNFSPRQNFFFFLIFFSVKKRHQIAREREREKRGGVVPRRFALRDVDAFFARRVLLLLLLRSVERERESKTF